MTGSIRFNLLRGRGSAPAGPFIPEGLGVFEIGFDGCRIIEKFSKMSKLGREFIQRRDEVRAVHNGDIAPHFGRPGGDAGGVSETVGAKF